MRKLYILSASLLTALNFMACSNQDYSSPSINENENIIPTHIYITSNNEDSNKQLRSENYYRVPATLTEIGLGQIGNKADFNGRLDVVKMNTIRDLPEAERKVKEFSLTRDFSSASHFTFRLKIDKIGKMPGNLEVEVKGLLLNSDGTFERVDTERLTVMNTNFTIKLIKGGLYKVYDRRSNLFVGYELQATIDSDGTIIGIKIVDAHVECSGLKK